MENQPIPDAPDIPADPRLDLRQIYKLIVQTLMSSLPPPLDLRSGTMEARMQRVKIAAARVSAMLPFNADEAELAARVVAASAHVSDCLHQAVRQEKNVKIACKLRAQAASMGREERGYRTLLLRVQAVRQKRDANDATRDAAVLTEYCVAGLMMDALDSVADATVQADAAVRDGRAEAVKQALAWDADMYAAHHPERTRLIRQHGGLPPGYDFAPPEQDLVRAIVTGTAGVCGKPMDGKTRRIEGRAAV